MPPFRRAPRRKTRTDVQGGLDLVRAELARLGAPRAEVRGGAVEPMLAETAPRPFSRAGWLFELKIDGFRAIAEKRGAEVSFHYRRGRDATHVYPDLARALAALPGDSVVLDGEIAVLDEKGLPSFQRLQKRSLLSQPLDVAAASRRAPAVYFAFDLLGFEGWDLRGLSLEDRKRLLHLLVPRTGKVRALEHIEEHGEELFAQASQAGLEGVMAKRSDAPYLPGRSASWLKIRRLHEDEFDIVGFTRPARPRGGFGALHLARRDPAGALVYAGRVGSGFSEELLADLGARLAALLLPSPPCTGTAPRGAGHVWVRPQYRCEVRYHQITEEGLLRQAVFVRLCETAEAAGQEATQRSEPEREAPVRGSAAGVPITNDKKVLWPEAGITKGELVRYYESIADLLLPWLRDRPLTVTRYPNGIAGKSFFQKNVPAGAPPWLRTAPTGDVDGRFSEHAGDADIVAPVIDDLRSLVWIANLAAIPLHIPADRFARRGLPDYSVIDLDPKDAPFAHVVKIARAVRALCEAAGLPSFIKTSGQKGMHILLPLGASCTHEESQQLAELLARIVERQLPEISTTERLLGRRKGRVYLDAWQNGRGRTVVAAWSVRPVPEATVSMPLHWKEVDERLDPRTFTLRNAAERARALGADPCAPALSRAVDLPAALARLARVLAKGS
jgi:bifunctional non-homologous end joining protein LigD